MTDLEAIVALWKDDVDRLAKTIRQCGCKWPLAERTKCEANLVDVRAVVPALEAALSHAEPEKQICAVMGEACRKVLARG